MASSVEASRKIITGLHEIMASRSPVQEKLNYVVNTIGEALSSEVCSVYIRRDGVLELFATRGLNQEAVNVVKLAVGDGLIGTIAENVETLNLDEAAIHPNFLYLPETGEEKFHSFAGVPIIRNEQAVGVLSVQHIKPHKYDDVELEALQTVAMVLSELIANAELIHDSDSYGIIDDGTVALSGLPIVVGMAAGVATFHQPRVRIEYTLAQDIEAERHRVYSAFDKMREQIDTIANQADFMTGGEHEEVLATYKMFAYDEGWSRRINEAIDSGLTAEAAIDRVQQHTRMRMRTIDDPLLAERMHDLEDLSNRLLRIVSGQISTAAQLGLRQDTILIARNLGPAELLEYDRRRLKGVILEEGSLTAHVTIVARALGIPVLGQIRGIRKYVRENDLLLLNSHEKSLVIRPSHASETAFRDDIANVQKKKAAYSQLRNEPAITLDGHKIDLMINAGLRDDIAALATVGADGVGLFRTEFQFLVSATLPRRERQEKFYRDVMDAAKDKPVTFRTIDIGGDKILPYLRQEENQEENPALGWRALRMGLSHPGLMKAQARALLEAAAGRDLRVMFPMISEPWEFDEAKSYFDGQLDYLKRRKQTIPRNIYYGAMLEVPSLADMLDILTPKLDFISIGTNDLTQFLFAADRAHPKLAERYDWLSPAILRFIDRVVKNTNDTQTSLSVCGEMGGRTLEALALIGLGVTKLSITPAAIGPVKSMIRSCNLSEVKTKIRQIISAPPQDIRYNILQWAEQHNIELD